MPANAQENNEQYNIQDTQHKSPPNTLKDNKRKFKTKWKDLWNK